ncbi:MAG: DUF3524 domain-containing protein [Candidatus Electrothrix sp. AR3]|nr:DUF3524 domain-containing protein [Candidatus Electrothrix sp. AR3]
MRCKQSHILLLEPYYGGSHKEFLTGLQGCLDCQFTLLTLPARKWKMRMQLAAPWFIAQIIDLVEGGNVFDSILTSTFLDVAVLRSLLANQGIQLPLAVYFHENQFSYPGQVRDPGIFQFSSINFTTALCADTLAFNSRYNLDTFLTGIRWYLKKTADMNLRHLEESILAKSIILYPGLDLQHFSSLPIPKDESVSKWKNKHPVIIWNHRWEHDKDPETFFQGLFTLLEYDFKIIVLGQHFRHQPKIFSQAKDILADRLLHFGFAESRAEYISLLQQGDIIASTAKHEFFGLAVLEGVRAGCRPLVPDRLSYKELFPRQYRYAENNFAKELEKLFISPLPLFADEAKKLTDPYSWPVLASQYQKWLISSS